MRDRWSGPERCGFCLQGYLLELEVFCAACDRPVCPLCVARGRVRAERLCPECAQEEAHAAEERT